MLTSQLILQKREVVAFFSFSGFIFPTLTITTVNLGERIINSLFASWNCKYNERLKEQRLQLQEQLSEQQQQQQQKQEQQKQEQQEQAQQEQKANHDDGKEPDKNNKEQTNSTTDIVASGEVRFPLPKDISIIISEEATGATVHRCLSGDFDGTEIVDVQIPRWVFDCVLYKTFLTRETAKYGFKLLTGDDQLPKLIFQGQGRLNAPRLLKIRKVIIFVYTKLDLILPDKSTLDEQTTSVITTPLSATPTNDSTNTNSTEENTIRPEEYLEILCGNKTVSPELNLASVKTFFWKSGDDLVLYYRRKQKYQHIPPRFDKSKTKKK